MNPMCSLYARKEETDNKTCMHDVMLDHAMCFGEKLLERIISDKMTRKAPSKETQIQ